MTNNVDTTLDPVLKFLETRPAALEGLPDGLPDTPAAAYAVGYLRGCRIGYMEAQADLAVAVSECIVSNFPSLR